MYPAFDWSVSLLTIMGISAGAISLAERPDRAIATSSFGSQEGYVLRSAPQRNINVLQPSADFNVADSFRLAAACSGFACGLKEFRR